MFKHHDPVPDLTVDYWLPVTKVNVTGSVVTATRAIDDHIECRPAPAVVSVVTRPDHSHAYRLTMAADNWETHHAKIDLLADARLASVDSSNKSGRAAALKDILGFAVAGAGFGAFAGPVGAGIGAAVALVTGGLLVGTAALGGADSGPAGMDEAGGESDTAGLPDYKKLNILPAYAESHNDDARLLAELRTAAAARLLEFAAAANGGTGDLQAIHQQLRLIRAELNSSEALYQKWLDSMLTTTTVTYDEEIAIERQSGIDEEAVKAWYDTKPGSELQGFHAACKALGIAIGFGFEPPFEPSQTPPPGKQTVDQRVHYRTLHPGVLHVYAVTEKEHGRADKLRVRSTQRVLVAATGTEEAVPLLAGKGNRSLNVAFDATGALTSISSEVTGSAIGTTSALGALPGALKDAFAAGTELGVPFSAAGRAAALKAQVDEKKAREDLSPAADPNKQLKDELERAELEARLKVANELASGGASAAVVVMGGASG
jgi:hypothetical protein